MPQGRQAPGVRPELCRGTAWRRPMGSIWVPAAETQTATSLGAERANAHSAHGCTTYPGLRRGSCAGRPDGAGEPLRRRLSPQAGRFVPAWHKAQQGLWLRASVGGLRREVEASLGRHLLRGLRESGEGRRLSPAGAVAAFGRASGREESFRDPWFPSHGTCPLSHPFPTGEAWGCVRAGRACWDSECGVALSHSLDLHTCHTPGRHLHGPAAACHDACPLVRVKCQICAEAPGG